MNEHQETLVHQFHAKYRESGIALCISLAALVASESWWFYGFFEQLRNKADHYQWAIWLGTMVTALTALFFSFFVQSQHYFGMRYYARFMFSIYDRNKDQKLHDKATQFFNRADRGVELLLGVAFINLLIALSYVGFYQPQKP